MPTGTRSKKATAKRTLSESIGEPAAKKKPCKNNFGRSYSADQTTQKAIIETIHPNGTHEYHQLQTQSGYSPLCDTNGAILEGKIQPIFEFSYRVRALFNFLQGFTKYLSPYVSYHSLRNRHHLTPSTPKQSKLPSLLTTPGGTQYNTKRKVNIRVKGEPDSILHFYSPKKGRTLKSVETLYPENFDPKKEIIFSPIKSPIKGGIEMPVEIGAHDRKKAKTQLKVMGESAKMAMLRYLKENEKN